MLAPPKRVGFHPNGAFLHRPHLLFLPHFSAYIVSVRTAGRRGLSLSRFCPSPFNPPFWAALARGTCRIFGSQIWIDSELEICREAGRTCPASWCPRLCCPSDSRGETTLCHICPQRPQHRVSPSRRCTGHPAHRRGTKRLTGADTWLHGFGLHFRQSIKGIAERKLAETLCSVYTSQKPFRENHVCRRAPL